MWGWKWRMRGSGRTVLRLGTWVAVRRDGGKDV